MKDPVRMRFEVRNGDRSIEAELEFPGDLSQGYRQDMYDRFLGHYSYCLQELGLRDYSVALAPDAIS